MLVSQVLLLCLLYKSENRRLERLTNFHKMTELTNSRLQIRTQALNQRLSHPVVSLLSPSICPSQRTASVFFRVQFQHLVPRFKITWWLPISFRGETEAPHTALILHSGATHLSTFRSLLIVNSVCSVLLSLPGTGRPFPGDSVCWNGLHPRFLFSAPLHTAGPVTSLNNLTQPSLGRPFALS